MLHYQQFTIKSSWVYGGLVSAPEIEDEMCTGIGFRRRGTALWRAAERRRKVSFLQNDNKNTLLKEEF